MKKTETKNIPLSSLFSSLEKQFGKGAIMNLGSKSNLNIDVIKTGSLALDLSLGVGGYPRGRIIEIFGNESSGKTTLALHAIAEAQKVNLQCAFIDAEHSIDPEYAKNLKIDVKKLILSQPDSGEQALSIAEALVRSEKIDLIVVDSVAALVPQVELDGEMSDQTIGAQARLMSKALRKLSGYLNKSNCTIIFINQVRTKIGVIYGNPETTSGGRALKFYSSIRLEVKKGARILDGPTITGQEMRLNVVKNKVSPPYKKVVVNLMFGKGIDFEYEVISLAIEFGLLEKSGSWYYYNKEKIGQGMSKVRDWFNINPKTFLKIKENLIAKILI